MNNRGSRFIGLAVAAIVLTAMCVSAESADNASMVENADSPASGSTAESAAGEPSAATRAALPALFGIMLGLQEDMRLISSGLWTGRYDSISAGAGAIANHPALAPEEAQTIAGILGDDMARFKTLDKKVHDLAVQLREAARAQDMEAVLSLDSGLRQGCVECHTAFRERLRKGVRE